MPNPRRELEALLGAFNLLAGHYLLNVEPGRELELHAALKTAMKGFSRSAKPLLKIEARSSRGGCPADWEQCPDGSCMPPGTC